MRAQYVLLFNSGGLKVDSGGHDFTDVGGVFLESDL